MYVANIGQECDSELHDFYFIHDATDSNVNTAVKNKIPFMMDSFLGLSYHGYNSNYVYGFLFFDDLPRYDWIKYQIERYKTILLLGVVNE